MSLMKRESYQRRGSVEREMESFWENFFGPIPVRGPQAAWPAIDVTENENEIRVVADLPGLSEKEIELTITDRQLTLKGEHKTGQETEGTHVHRVERRRGAFERTIGLPKGVDSNKVTAHFKQGVLEIVLPKNDSAKVRTVKIN